MNNIEKYFNKEEFPLKVGDTIWFAVNGEKTWFVVDQIEMIIRIKENYCNVMSMKVIARKHNNTKSIEFELPISCIYKDSHELDYATRIAKYIIEGVKENG